MTEVFKVPEDVRTRLIAKWSAGPEREYGVHGELFVCPFPERAHRLQDGEAVGMHLWELPQSIRRALVQRHGYDLHDDVVLEGDRLRVQPRRRRAVVGADDDAEVE